MSFNDFCDKCNRKARRYISSTSAPTISLCEKHYQEYEDLMEKTRQKFLSEKETDDVIEEEENDCFSLSIGDKVYCLRCGNIIELNKKTMIFDSEAEYIFCPYCKRKIDTQIYHLYGKKYKGENHDK